jgi:hypothetical protein
MLSNNALVRLIFFEGLSGSYVLRIYLKDCFYCLYKLRGWSFVLLFMLMDANGRELYLAWLLAIAEFLNCL